MDFYENGLAMANQAAVDRLEFRRNMSEKRSDRLVESGRVTHTSDPVPRLRSRVSRTALRNAFTVIGFGW